MTVRVGINGFGRIGRNFFRAVEESGADVEVVAFNDLGDDATQAHLLRYDSILGRFGGQVDVVEGGIEVDGRLITSLAERDPAQLPWGDLGVDVVVESTGFFTDGDAARAHVEAGATKVVISAPAKNEDITIVMGVNDDQYDGTRHTIISNASCTTNCLAPMAKVLNDGLGITRGLMTTIHAYTADQNLQDGPHKDLRRARAAAINIVPASTGAAKAIGLVLPELKGKLSGNAIRVPTPNVSMAILNLNLGRETTVDELNTFLRETSLNSELRNQIDYIASPEVVSTDFVGSKRAGIVDQVTSEDELLGTAVAYAQSLAATRGPVLAEIKRGLYEDVLAKLADPAVGYDS